MSKLFAVMALLVACSPAAPEPLPEPKGPCCFVQDPFGTVGPSVAFYAPSCQGHKGEACFTAYGDGVCSDSCIVP